MFRFYLALVCLAMLATSACDNLACAHEPTPAATCPQATIRPADQDDLAALVNIDAHALQAAPWSEIDFKTTSTKLCVAEIDGTVAGYVAVNYGDAEKKNLTIERIAVCPQYQRCGVGTALVNHVKEWAASNGGLVVSVPYTPDSAAFWKANGFSDQRGAAAKAGCNCGCNGDCGGKCGCPDCNCAKSAHGESGSCGSGECGGRLGLQRGQPARNVGRACLAVPRAVCRACANFHQNRKEARQSRRASGGGLFGGCRHCG